MDTLVLGGSRFIGLHLVRLLHGRGDAVSVLNRGQTPAELPDGVRRLSADRGDPSQVKAALKDASYDAVFDISGYTPASLRPVVKALEGRVGHFVFCSTTSVYAPSETAPIDEGFPLHRGPDASQYARDKVACEDLLTEAFERRGFPATILRPPYVCGPDDYLRQREFSFFARLSQRRRIIIPGDGLTLFHSVHVDDLASAFAAVPGRPDTLGQAYTVAGRDAITANGYVEAIGEAMGVVPDVVHLQPKDYVDAMRRQGLASDSVFPFEWSVSRVYAIEKAKRDLGWAPTYSMAEGLAMTYRWWREKGLDREPWDFSHEDEMLETIGSACLC